MQEIKEINFVCHCGEDAVGTLGLCHDCLMDKENSNNADHTKDYPMDFLENGEIYSKTLENS